MNKLIEQLADVLEEILREWKRLGAFQQVSELRKGAVSAVARKHGVEERTIVDGFIRRLRPKISSMGQFDDAVTQWLHGRPQLLQGALLGHIGSGPDAARIFDVVESQKGDRSDEVAASKERLVAPPTPPQDSPQRKVDQLAAARVGRSGASHPKPPSAIGTSIRFSSFPRTAPPPDFVIDLVEVFKAHEADVGTAEPHLNRLTKDGVLAQLRPDLEQLGFEVESGEKKEDKIERPVFFGENGIPTVRYEVDAYHADWRCGLEVEAGRGWLGNAVYRDLILASVMVGVDYFVLAVANGFRYKTGGKIMTSHDYYNATNLADTIFSHDRLELPYRLTVIGY